MIKMKIQGSFPILGKNEKNKYLYLGSNSDSVEECYKINDKDKDPGIVT
jgi:hypothetical protein